jgi:ABC-2 type transport system ATP-binding protein
VRVASPEPFITAVESSGGATSANNDGTLIITGMDAKAIGDLALSKRIAVYELTAQASLEDAFMEMTSDAVEYRGAK